MAVESEKALLKGQHKRYMRGSCGLKKERERQTDCDYSWGGGRERHTGSSFHYNPFPPFVTLLPLRSTPSSAAELSCGVASLCVYGSHTHSVFLSYSSCDWDTARRYTRAPDMANVLDPDKWQMILVTLFWSDSLSQDHIYCCAKQKSTVALLLMPYSSRVSLQDRRGL